MGPVPQRIALVLPSTAEFDSRTYRIASSLVARGHSVTVLARLAPGLAAVEEHPAGYRIVRVPADAVDGLPLPRVLRRALRRSRGGRRAPAGGERPGAPERTDRQAAIPATPRTGPLRRVLARVRRLFGGLRRISAMALIVRSQTRASRAVDSGADIYHGMAYMGVPVAVALAARHPGSHVVYDARDIYVDAGNLSRAPGLVRRLVGTMERRWARRVSRVITVNRPYAEVMGSRWGIETPLIILNCSYRTPAADPPPRRFHEALGLSPERRVVLYQGGFSRDRGIEQLVEAIADVPDAVLVLLGYGHLERELRDLAATLPHRGRVFVLPAIAPDELLSWVASADVVAMPIQPSTLNHRLTTPNKLFEAIAAGVPVVASDMPGMSGIITETGAGVLVNPSDPSAIAAGCRKLLAIPLDQREAQRTRIIAAAHDRYNWESQADLLLAEYGRITGKPW